MLLIVSNPGNTREIKFRRTEVQIDAGVSGKGFRVKFEFVLRREKWDNFGYENEYEI